MTKQQFLSVIRQELSGLSANDLQESLEYYSEMIDDLMEDGKSEAEAVASMGDPRQIARKILSEMPLPKLIKAKTKPQKRLERWQIVLLIAGSPLWIVLAAAALIIILAIYIVLWSVVVSFYAVDLAFAATGIALTLTSPITSLSGGATYVLTFAGLGLIFAGLSILWFFLCNKIAWVAVKLGEMIWRGIKFMIIGKGRFE